MVTTIVFYYYALMESSGAASSISEGAIFIYSCSGQLSSFEIDLISKELNCPEHEYMNMAPSLIELAAPLMERSTRARKAGLQTSGPKTSVRFVSTTLD